MINIFIFKKQRRRPGRRENLRRASRERREETTHPNGPVDVITIVVSHIRLVDNM